MRPCQGVTTVTLKEGETTPYRKLRKLYKKGALREREGIFFCFVLAERRGFCIFGSNGGKLGASSSILEREKLDLTSKGLLFSSIWQKKKGSFELDLFVGEEGNFLFYSAEKRDSQW